MDQTALEIEQNQNPQPANRKRDNDDDGEVVDPPAKRGRGRPPLSGALERSEGFGSTPRIIEVEKGEDIASKVMEFSDQRSVFILSARGAISSVTLSGTATYEGRFEIINLSANFVNRSGSLKVALARPDGRMLEGTVIGSLVAATQVKVLVGSIVLETKKRISSSENSSGIERVIRTR